MSHSKKRRPSLKSTKELSDVGKKQEKSKRSEHRCELVVPGETNLSPEPKMVEDILAIHQRNGFEAPSF
jgi:hypothetical protein